MGKQGKNLWIVAICIALLCAMLAGCGSLGGNGSSGGEKFDQPVIQTVYIDGKVNIVYGETVFLTERAQGSVWQSLDGTKGIFLSDGDLVYLHDGKAEKIAQHVEKCRISLSGMGVAYQMNEESGEAGNLYLYDGQTGETTLVHADADGKLRQYMLSPDGKTVVYSMYQQVSKLMVHQNGTSQMRLELGATVNLISTDNDANTIYYWESRHLKTVNSAGEATVLNRLRYSVQDNFYNPGMFQANADHTELFYQSNDGRRLSVRGGEGILLYEGTGMEGSYIALMESANMAQVETEYLITYDVESFQGQTMKSSGSFLLPGEDGKYAAVAKYEEKEMRQSWLDPSGSYFYYVNPDDQLHVIDLRNGGKVTKLAEKVKEYVVANDCSVVYYYDDLSDYGGSLYRCNAKDGSDVKKIEVEFTEIILSGSNQLYALKGMREQADLYQVNSRGKAELVLEDVQWYTVYYNEIERYLHCGEDFYLLQDGVLVKMEQKQLEL